MTILAVCQPQTLVPLTFRPYFSRTL